jgi:hypothetical protein
VSDRTVSSASELVDAIASAGEVRLTSSVDMVPTLRLAAGRPVGGKPGTSLAFADGQDGLVLSSDNTIEGSRIVADADRRAILNDDSVGSLGSLHLIDVTTVGQVQIVASGAVRAGHVSIEGLHVEAADTRDRSELPAAYGVQALQGVVMVWNLQADPVVEITADIVGVSCGSPDAPVRGSGVMVGGASDASGRMTVSRLHTGAVYSDGGLPAGIANRICGGVFVLYGANVASVRNSGPVTTFGVNDMVLDSWGMVDEWVAEAPITSLVPAVSGSSTSGGWAVCV